MRRPIEPRTPLASIWERWARDTKASAKVPVKGPTEATGPCGALRKSPDLARFRSPGPLGIKAGIQRQRGHIKAGAELWKGAGF